MKRKCFLTFLILGVSPNFLLCWNIVCHQARKVKNHWFIWMWDCHTQINSLPHLETCASLTLAKVEFCSFVDSLSNNLFRLTLLPRGKIRQVFLWQKKILHSRPGVQCYKGAFKERKTVPSYLTGLKSKYNIIIIKLIWRWHIKL